MLYNAPPSPVPRPGVDEGDIMFRVAICRFGPELARKVYGRR